MFFRFVARVCHVHDIHYNKDYNLHCLLDVSFSHVHDIHYNKDYNCNTQPLIDVKHVHDIHYNKDYNNETIGGQLFNIK